MLRQYKLQLAGVALALILAVGFAVPFALAAVWLVEMYEVYGGGKQSSRTDQVFIAADGTPLIQSFGKYRSYRALDGTPVSLTVSAPEIRGAWLRAQMQIEQQEDTSSAVAGWAQRVFGFDSDASSSNYWYFVVTSTGINGRGYFAGFDKQSWRRTSFIGIDGFHSEPLTADLEIPLTDSGSRHREPAIGASMLQTGGYTPSEYSSRHQNWIGFSPSLVYVSSAGRLLLVDLSSRTVTNALHVDEIFTLGRVVRPTAADANLDQRHLALLFAARCRDRVAVLDTSDQSSQEFQLPAELRSSDFMFYPLHDGTGICVVNRGELRSNRDDCELTWITPDGNVLRKETVQLEGDHNWEKWARQGYLQAGIAAPAPILTSALPVVIDISGGSASLRDRYAAAAPAIALAVLIGVFAALLTANLQRKYHVPHNLAWLVFVFLFGLPGYIGYRLHRRWPIREQAPPPVLTGIEIFA